MNEDNFDLFGFNNDEKSAETDTEIKEPTLGYDKKVFSSFKHRSLFKTIFLYEFNNMSSSINRKKKKFDNASSTKNTIKNLLFVTIIFLVYGVIQAILLANSTSIESAQINIFNSYTFICVLAVFVTSMSYVPNKNSELLDSLPISIRINYLSKILASFVFNCLYALCAGVIPLLGLVFYLKDIVVFLIGLLYLFINILFLTLLAFVIGIFFNIISKNKFVIQIGSTIVSLIISLVYPVVSLCMLDGGIPFSYSFFLPFVSLNNYSLYVLLFISLEFLVLLAISFTIIFTRKETIFEYKQRKQKKFKSEDSLFSKFRKHSNFVSVLNYSLKKHKSPLSYKFIFSGLFLSVFYGVMIIVLFYTVPSLKFLSTNLTLSIEITIVLTIIFGSISLNTLNCICVSRDSKELLLLKSFPISFKNYIHSKALSGIIISLPNILLVYLSCLISFQSTNFLYYLITFIGISFILLVNSYLCVFIDIIHPYLNIEDENTLSNNNLNLFLSFIPTFISLLFNPLLVYFGYLITINTSNIIFYEYFVYFGIILYVISFFVIEFCLIKVFEKRIQNIELL